MKNIPCKNSGIVCTKLAIEGTSTKVLSMFHRRYWHEVKFVLPHLLCW